MADASDGSLDLVLTPSLWVGLCLISMFAELCFTLTGFGTAMVFQAGYQLLFILHFTDNPNVAIADSQFHAVSALPCCFLAWRRGRDIDPVYTVYLVAGMTGGAVLGNCLLYTSPSPRDGLLSRMPSSA